MNASAPGKVILLGEHAVVYGEPAIAAAIGARVRVRVEDGPGAELMLPGGLLTPPEVLDGVVAIAREVGRRRGFRAFTESEIPLGGGLGSSAALGVALARAFSLDEGRECLPAEAARLAMLLERVLHGAASGVDPAACAHGGAIWFERLHVEPLELRAQLWLVIAPTGIPRGTRATVLPLAKRRLEAPELYEPMLSRLGELVRGGRESVERGDLEDLGARFDEAHVVLGRLGVSCVELDRTVAALKAAGALGAKLTGAGGGGAAIGLARDGREAARIAAAVGGGAFAERLG